MEPILKKVKEPILKIENMNIVFQQKSGKKIIVENGEFEVNAGEFVLILGENGAGKSSIFRSIVRASSPYQILPAKKVSRINVSTDCASIVSGASRSVNSSSFMNTRTRPSSQH